jgi:hypothetical protein
MIFVLQVSVTKVTVDAETDICKEHVQLTLRKRKYKHSLVLLLGTFILY